MTLGMIVTLFSNKTRFSSIKKNLLKIRNSRGFSILCFVMLSSSVLAESKIDSLLQAQALPYEQAESFGMLVVQDQGGRMKPVNTLASEVLRKVSRQSSFQGLSANQVLLGMAQNPYLWQLAPMIKVNHEGLREQLGLKNKYNSFLSFF